MVASAALLAASVDAVAASFAAAAALSAVSLAAAAALSAAAFVAAAALSAASLALSPQAASVTARLKAVRRAKRRDFIVGCSCRNRLNERGRVERAGARTGTATASRALCQRADNREL